MRITLDLEQGGARAIVAPMNGHLPPYRMDVTVPGGAESTFVGLPTAASCVESFVSWLRGRGSNPEIDTVWGWSRMAAAVDQPAAGGSS